jgi:hypothetical protein
MLILPKLVHDVLCLFQNKSGSTATRAMLNKVSLVNVCLYHRDDELAAVTWPATAVLLLPVNTITVAVAHTSQWPIFGHTWVVKVHSRGISFPDSILLTQPLTSRGASWKLHLLALVPPWSGTPTGSDHPRTHKRPHTRTMGLKLPSSKQISPLMGTLNKHC